MSELYKTKRKRKVRRRDAETSSSWDAEQKATLLTLVDAAKAHLKKRVAKAGGDDEEKKKLKVLRENLGGRYRDLYKSTMKVICEDE